MAWVLLQGLASVAFRGEGGEMWGGGWAEPGKRDRGADGFVSHFAFGDGLDAFAWVGERGVPRRRRGDVGRRLGLSLGGVTVARMGSNRSLRSAMAWSPFKGLTPSFISA